MEYYTLKQLIFYLCMNYDSLWKCYLRLDCDEQTKVNILYQLHENGFRTYTTNASAIDDRLKTVEVWLNRKVKPSEFEIFGQFDKDKFMRLPKYE